MKFTYATNLLHFPHPALQMVLSAGVISSFTVALIKNEEQSAFDKKIL